MVSYFFMQVGTGAHPHSSLLSTFLDCSDIQNVPATSPGFALPLPTHISAQHTESCLRLTILIWNVLGTFLLKQFCSQLSCYWKRGMFLCKPLSCIHPQHSRVETDLRLKRGLKWQLLSKDNSLSGFKATRLCRFITRGLLPCIGRNTLS